MRILRADTPGEASRRSALTLLELIVVVALLGIFALVAVSRIDPSTLHDFGAKTSAQRLAADLVPSQTPNLQP